MGLTMKKITYMGQITDRAGKRITHTGYIVREGRGTGSKMTILKTDVVA